MFLLVQTFADSSLPLAIQSIHLGGPITEYVEFFTEKNKRDAQSNVLSMNRHQIPLGSLPSFARMTALTTAFCVIGRLCVSDGIPILFEFLP